mgnify:CR=1 FL=1
MDIRDAIIEINGLFNLDLADRIVNYINYIELKPLGVGTTDKPNLEIRDVKGRFLIDYKNPNNMSDNVFLQLIKNEIFKMLPMYVAKYPKLLLDQLTQCDLLKYNVGGKYEVHVDSFINARRELSCIINLNDEYEGGELGFYDASHTKEILRCNLKKVGVIFFPITSFFTSNFIYPHKINPIKKGTRYSIVAWIA